MKRLGLIASLGLAFAGGAAQAQASNGTITQAFGSISGERGRLSATVTWTDCGTQSVYTPEGDKEVPWNCKWSVGLVVGELDDYGDCPRSPLWPRAIGHFTIENPDDEEAAEEGPNLNGTLSFTHRKLPEGWQAPCLYLIAINGEPVSYNECKEAGLPAEWCPTKTYQPEKTILDRSRIRLRPNVRRHCHFVQGFSPSYGDPSYIKCERRKSSRLRRPY